MRENDDQQGRIDNEVTESSERLRRHQETQREDAEVDREDAERWRNEDELSRVRAELARENAEDRRHDIIAAMLRELAELRRRVELLEERAAGGDAGQS